jgi:Zn-dependent protease with chaperone function
MVVSILIFAGLYLVLLAAALKLVYFTITLRADKYTLWVGLFQLGCVVGSGMLVAFLLKFLFKRSPAPNEDRLELTPADHPDLFSFVHQLCAEAGAARPKHIYITSEVNAAVFYDNTFRSLFWPTRKNLLIGLGLVNGLNLTEFKAVLAHEFGHFAQRSMKLGSYVHTLSRLIHDMVYTRDKWDEMLAGWRALDIRVSAVAWLMTGLVWVARKLLELAYQGIHLVHASLSREMEFQADRVAVSLAGSTAMCQVLYQLGPATQALASATQQLGVALEHGLATTDVFYHQSNYLREQLATAAPEPATPAGQPQRRFRPDEVSIVAMYASHPADYLREEQAQRVFVPGPSDDRSPWLLFNHSDQLRQAITRTLYPVFEPDTEPEWKPAAEVEEFLAIERAETDYAPHYGGTYGCRTVSVINPAKVDSLTDQTILPPGPLSEVRAQLYGPELRQRTEAHAARHADLDKLELFKLKLTKDPSFTVAGVSYPAAQAPAVAARLQQENEEHHAWLKEFDRQVVAVHWRMLATQPERRPEWEARFSLHHHILLALRDVVELTATMNQTLQQLGQQSQLTERQAENYCSRFEETRLGLAQVLADAQPVALLPLTHLTGFTTLADFIRHDLAVPGPAQLNNEWLAANAARRIIEQRLWRIYFKNLGVLLRLQEDIAAAYQPVAVAA